MVTTQTLGLTKSSLDEEAQANIDNLIEKASIAAKQFRTFSQEQVDYIVQRVCLDILPHSLELAEMIQGECGFGTTEDKFFKIRALIELVHNYIRDKKSVGIINKLPNGIVEIAQPIGVIGAITNCTGTGAVEFLKIINSLKTRNSLVIAPHPRTKHSASYVAKLMHDYAVRAGAPEGCIQCIETPSVEGTKYLMTHDSVSLVWATGGSAMVKAAYSSGKPTLGVGPGNTPVIVDEDTDPDLVAESILISKTFENGTSCTAESNLFVHKGIKEALLSSLNKYGYYILNDAQKQVLIDFMYPLIDDQRRFNSDIVGMDPKKIITSARLNVPLETKILVCEMNNNEIGEDYPLAGEKLSNIIGLYTVQSAREGINLAIQTLEYVGKGHTAVIFSNNEGVKREFAERVPASRLVANAPASQSGAFDTYNKRLPTYSVGCGIMANNSTTQNISYIDLLDIKRYSERMSEDRWYHIPKEIYKDQEAKKYLSTLKDKRIFAVIDPGITKMIEEKLNTWLPKDCKLFVCNDVEPDPSFKLIEIGFNKIKEFKPDTILAIGGGSAIDSAKGIWIRYEHPHINLKGLGTPFFDIYEQILKLPKLGERAKLVTIPTTCGTGSEVTPFAVFTDTSSHRKFAVGNYEMIPNVTLLIPELLEKLPKSIMVDTAFDALSHAIEAFASVKDCEEADLNSIKAVQMIFENLPNAYLENDLKAKVNLLYAASEAGKAISNAFVGINHSLAHQLGAQFKVSHGKAIAIFLEPVIRYNSAPVKEIFRITPYPNNKIYNAGSRYAELARKALGIYADSEEKIVNEFCLRLKKLMKTVNLEQNVSQLGIKEDDYIERIPLMAKNALQDFCTGGNPRFPSLNELEKLYEGVC